MICVYVWAFYTYFVSPTGFRWRALFGDTNYPAGYEIHGIDISHYQGKIDWDKLRDSNIEGYPLRFVMIKSTEGLRRTSARLVSTDLYAEPTTSGATNRRHATRLISS